MSVASAAPSSSFEKQHGDIEGQEKQIPVDSVHRHDPNNVDFDGPDDPLRPVNWPVWKKWSLVGALAAMTLVSPLASSMFAPGVSQVTDEFDNHSLLLSGFVVSVYILGYAFGPLIIAPMSELYGRSPAYYICNVLFVIFTIACAVAPTLNSLIGFRFLAGVAGSAVLTNGGGSIADMFVPQERGKALSIWSSGPLLGPVIGPICGGFLTQAAGWRWVFWVLTIASGVVALIFPFLVHETYEPIILERKTKQLRKETGNPALRSKLDSGLTPGKAFRQALLRPAKMMLQPIVLSLNLYMSVVYGYLYLLFTTISAVFEDSYHFSTGIVGLSYLGVGLGMMSALVIFGLFSDRYLRKKALTGEMKPEHRLPPMIPAAFIIPIGLFIYGWTAQYQVQWIVPIIGTGILGAGILGTFLSVQTYLVDAFNIYASSALAANTVLRSLVGAILPLAGPSMYKKLGLGWGNSLLGFIAVAFIPLPFLFYRYGEKIRKDPRWQPKL